ncbi:MAG: ATP phosphoribosyltransferase [Bacteroidales bacterium]
MDTLKIAIQKSGRLNEDSLQLLKECDISLDNYKDQLSAKSQNFPLEVVYLRNSDIPKYVEDQIVDCAIIGENTAKESQVSIKKVINLGFARCRMSLAFPKSINLNSIDDIEGMKIATSYPYTLKEYLNSQGVSVNIHLINGSVEIAPALGLADGIFDIVSSGSTLFKNNLREQFSILKSEACIYSSQVLSKEKQEILDKLVFRTKSVLASKNNKYVLFNTPNEKIPEIINLLPGIKSPTILPLYKKDWSSIHSVINESKFWEIIDELRALGAEGILIIPIEKMIL